jgi:hypothetical protein
MPGKAKKPRRPTKAKAGKRARRSKREVSVRDEAAAEGARVKVRLPRPVKAADRLEAEQFVLGLDLNEQLARQPGPLPPGATHQLESQGKGPPRLVRKRFSSR